MRRGIKKQWVVNPTIIPVAIGRIIWDGQYAGFVQYSEDQEPIIGNLDLNYVKRFETLPEAIDFLERNDYSKEKLEKRIYNDFPSFFPNHSSSGQYPGEFGKDYVMDSSGKPVASWLVKKPIVTLEDVRNTD